ncbi:gp47 domain protein [Mycobacterium xenopi 3993]|nr:gp47 domain protein [Mycobacterium xenopi 3993]
MMAVDSNGRWIGFGVGDVDDPNLPRSAPNWHAIELLTSKLHDKYAWARARGIVAQPRYDEQVAGAVEEFCNRAGLAVIRDRQGFAVATLAVRTRLGSFPPPAPTLPIMFTVEGHMSNMFAGPVADTATQLESEGVCHHQPIGYNNAALPFDNDSGIKELARLVGATVIDNGVPFPASTPWALGVFSQGAIIGSYFYFDYLARASRCTGGYPTCAVCSRTETRAGRPTASRRGPARGSPRPALMAWTRIGGSGCPVTHRNRTTGWTCTGRATFSPRTATTSPARSKPLSTKR